MSDSPEETSKSLVSQAKTLLPILMVVATLAGFYYKTLYRLDALEADIEDLKKDVSQLSDTAKTLDKDLKRLKRKKE